MSQNVPGPPPPPPEPGAVPPPPPDGGWGPPPGGDPAAPQPAPAPAASNKLLLIALAVVAVLVVGGGALMMSGGGDDEEAGQGGTSSTTGISGDQGGGPTEAAGEGDGSSGPDGEGGGGQGRPAPAVTSADPTVIVEAFLAAIVEGDCETQMSLLSENMSSGMTPEMAIEECELINDSPESIAPVYADMEVRDPQVDGDVATVMGMGELDGSPLQMTFTLIRDGDTWLIDDIA